MEPYTNDFTYWHDREVKFESQLGSSGIYVTVYEKMSKEEQEDFKHHIWLPWRKEQIPEDAECTVCPECEKAVKRLLEKK